VAKIKKIRNKGFRSFSFRSVIDQIGAGLHFFSPQNLQIEPYQRKQSMLWCQEVRIIRFLTTGSHGNPVQTNGHESRDLHWFDFCRKRRAVGHTSFVWVTQPFESLAKIHGNALCEREHFYCEKKKTGIKLIPTLCHIFFRFKYIVFYLRKTPGQLN
jgi:hypothetical protein